MNYETPDPECDLDYVPNTCRKQEVRAALKINLGFGGHNAAVIYKRF
jgi:3-oxoacyl-(acyl-carrier-protein) synthase